MPSYDRYSKAGEEVFHPNFPVKQIRNDKKIYDHHAGEYLTEYQFVDVDITDFQVVKIGFVLKVVFKKIPGFPAEDSLSPGYFFTGSKEK